MKKLLALLLAVLMIFSLAACNGSDVDQGQKPSSVPVDNDDVDNDDVDEDLDEDEPLVLEGKDEFVVCVKKGSQLKLDSIKDIKGLNVGVTRECDGEKIAKHYKANIVIYGGDLDAFSDLNGGVNLDCAIVRKSSALVYVDDGTSEIILDPIVIE